MIFFKLYKCFRHGLQMCMCFWYNSLIILSCLRIWYLVELVIFGGLFNINYLHLLVGFEFIDFIDSELYTFFTTNVIILILALLILIFLIWWSQWFKLIYTLFFFCDISLHNLGSLYVSRAIILYFEDLTFPTLPFLGCVFFYAPF